MIAEIVTPIFTLIGIAMAQGDYARADALRRKAREEIEKMNPDELAKVKAEVGDSAFASVTEAPEGRQAQLMALQRLQGMAAGDDPESAAEYARAQAEAAANERGVRMAALQRLAQRGAGATSGLALAAQQDAAQASTQAANTRTLETAAAARRRALEALGMQGQLGGQLRSSDYQLQRDRASAQDVINRFNADARWRQATGVYDARGNKSKQLSELGQAEQDKGDRLVAMMAATGKVTGTTGDVAMKVANPAPTGGA